MKTLLTLPAGRKQTATPTVRADGATYSRGAVVRPKPADPSLCVHVVAGSAQAKRFEREPIDARAFYFVWKLNGSVPRVRHPTVETAERERVRLQALDRAGVYVTYRAVAIAGLSK